MILIDILKKNKIIFWDQAGLVKNMQCKLSISNEDRFV